MRETLGWGRGERGWRLLDGRVVEGWVVLVHLHSHTKSTRMGKKLSVRPSL